MVPIHTQIVNSFPTHAHKPFDLHLQVLDLHHPTERTLAEGGQDFVCNENKNGNIAVIVLLRSHQPQNPIVALAFVILSIVARNPVPAAAAKCRRSSENYTYESRALRKVIMCVV